MESYIKPCIFRLLLIFVLFINKIRAQDTLITIWPNGSPAEISDSNYIEEVQKDTLGIILRYRKISTPRLSVFLANPEFANGTSVLILPGGGYSHLTINKEGYKVAKWLNTLGISAFVLKYRLPSDKIMVDKTLAPLQDAQEAIRIIRRNSKRWDLDSSKVGVMGFSAGGHLAATLSNHFNFKESGTVTEVTSRPDFSILIYPVISMEDGITHNGSRDNLLGINPNSSQVEKFSMEKQVSNKTPPTFLVHASDDKSVPVENSLRYYNALKQFTVPVEMHLYQMGGHGFGLGNSGTNKNWPNECKKWLRLNLIIP